MAMDALSCMTGTEDDKLVAILSRVRHENFRNMIELARATIPDQNDWTVYSLLGDVKDRNEGQAAETEPTRWTEAAAAIKQGENEPLSVLLPKIEGTLAKVMTEEAAST